MSIATIVSVFLSLSMIQQSRSQISIEPTKSFTLTEGESLTLHCIIRNPLYTRVEWFLDKTQLSLNIESYHSDYTVDQSATDNNGLPQFSLFCPSVTKENAGKYKCKAFREDRPPAKSVLEVDVYYTPAPQYPICYYRANTSSLHCESEKGNPLMELQWSRVSSNITSAVMSTNSDGGRFTHTKIVRVEELPKPLSANDLLFCSFQTEQRRNCTLSYIEIFNAIQPPVLNTEEPSVLVGEDVSLTCDVTNYFTDSVIAFSYGTIPTDVSVSTEQVNDTITFIDVPPSVRSISVNCFLKWGILQSASSTVTNISVIHPSTQSPSSTEDQLVRDNIKLKVSLSTPTTQTDPNTKTSAFGGIITSKATSGVLVNTSEVALNTQTPIHIPTKTTSSSSTPYLAREMDTSVMLTDQKTVNLVDNNISSNMETTTIKLTITTDISKMSLEVFNSTNSTSLSPSPQSTQSSLLPPTPPPSPPLLPSSMNKDPHLGTTFGSSTEMETESLKSTSVPHDMKTTDVVRRRIFPSTQKPSTLPGSTLPRSSSKLPPTTPSSSSSLIISRQLSSTLISSQATETSYFKSSSLPTSTKTTEIAKSTVSSSTSPLETTSLPSSVSVNPSSVTFLPPIMQTSVKRTSSPTSKTTKANIFAGSTRPSPRIQTKISTTTEANDLGNNSTYAFEKKYLIPSIVVPLLLIILGTTAALLYARRRCTEHGQYRVVTKMIWVNNGTSTAVPLKEIHI